MIPQSNDGGVPMGGDNQTPDTSGPRAPMNENLLDVLTKDFQRLQEQKARQTGGVEARTLQAIAFSEGEQYTDYRNKSIFTEPQDSNKLYLTFNLVGRRVAKLLGRLSAADPPLKTKPDKKDPKAFAAAEVCDQLLNALDQKLDQASTNWEIFYWLLHGGVAFEHTPWIPNATMEPVAQYTETGELLFKDLFSGEPVPESQMMSELRTGRPPESFEIFESSEMTGDVGSEIYGPLNVFIDQSVKSIEHLAADQRIYLASIKTAGWVEDNFGIVVEGSKDFKILSSQFTQTGDSTGGHWLKDLIPLVQGTAGADDPPMVVVVQGYAPQSKTNPRGRYTCFIPGKQILHDDENPYGEIPITDFHWKPVTTSFWTNNYISDLIAPQRFINKRLSQLGEQSNASIYSNILLGGSLTKEDIPADQPGVVRNALAENGMPLVARLAPPEIPNWFMESIDLTVKLFNDIAGGADLMEEHKFPGQLRGPMAVPMLQEIIDTEWGPFFKHFAARIARVRQMRLERVEQFYPPVRTLHYTSKDLKDEVLTFHKEKIFENGYSYAVTVEPGAILPELRALREARLRERLASPLAILYMDERTGRLDKSKIAQDLQFGDTGRESKEGQYRKLAQEIVSMLWEGKPVPPVQPFYDHAPMMDELESAMATTEFLRASPPIQQLFLDRWTQHREFMMQEAAAQQQALQGHMIQSAVAQATQQAAAMAASEAVNSSMSQVHEQSQMVHSGQTRQLVGQAQAKAGGGPSQPPQKPPQPFSRPPQG